MVRFYFPQGPMGAIGANTNYPPQSGSENPSPPVGGTMEYQNFVTMEYENLDDMDYEA